jgi:hypothetical protein
MVLCCLGVKSSSREGDRDAGAAQVDERAIRGLAEWKPKLQRLIRADAGVEDFETASC